MMLYSFKKNIQFLIIIFFIVCPLAFSVLADNLYFANFDDGGAPNLLGGAYGSWGTAILQHTNVNQYGNRGRTLALKYDVSAGNAGIWMNIGATVDLNNYHYLSFQIKGETGNEAFIVQLFDGLDYQNIKINNYLPAGKVTTSFQKVVIPLEAFRWDQDGFDENNVTTISWQIDLGMGSPQGTIFIDEVLLGTGAGPIYVDNVEYVSGPISIGSETNNTSAFYLPAGFKSGTSGTPITDAQETNSITNDSYSGSNALYMKHIVVHDGAGTWAYAQTDIATALYGVTTRGIDVSSCNQLRFQAKKGSNKSSERERWIRLGYDNGSALTRSGHALVTNITTNWKTYYYTLDSGGGSTFDADGGAPDYTKIYDVQFVTEWCSGSYNTNITFVDDIMFVDTDWPISASGVKANGKPMSHHFVFKSNNIITSIADSESTDPSLEGVRIECRTNPSTINWYILDHDYNVSSSKTTYTNQWDTADPLLLLPEGDGYDFRIIPFDSSDNKGYTAYTNCVVDRTSPTLTSFNPSDNITNIHPSSNIDFEIDDNLGASSNSILVKINSSVVLSNGVFRNGFQGSESKITKDGYGFNISIDKETIFNQGSWITVNITAEDKAGNSISSNYQFKTTEGPVLSNLKPAPGSVNVSTNTNITLTIDDDVSVNSNSILIKVENITVVTDGQFQNGFNGPSSQILRSGNGFDITIDNEGSFSYSEVVNVSIYGEDNIFLSCNTNFSFTTIGSTIPSFAGFDPVPFNTGVNIDANIYFEIDDDTGIDLNSLYITVNSNIAYTNSAFQSGYSGMTSADGPGYNVTVDPDSNFDLNRTNYISISVADINNNVIVTNYWFKTISDNVPPTTSINISGGEYIGEQTIILSADETADIYFAIDDTVSMKYVSPITISKNTTLKYFAIDTAGNAENIKTQIYIIIKTPKDEVASYPNCLDFSKTDHVKIVFAQADTAQINVYNMRGVLVKTFNRIFYSANSFHKWFGKNDNGNKVGSGLYIIHIKGDKIDKKVKVLLLK